jgi:hypothetical protein
VWIPHCALPARAALRVQPISTRATGLRCGDCVVPASPIPGGALRGRRYSLFSRARGRSVGDVRTAARHSRRNTGRAHHGDSCERRLVGVRVTGARQRAAASAVSRCVAASTDGLLRGLGPHECHAKPKLTSVDLTSRRVPYCQHSRRSPTREPGFRCDRKLPPIGRPATRADRGRVRRRRSCGMNTPSL